MTRVAVVGAGIIGLATAYFARAQGADVTVVERGSAGGGCSYGNAGWICPGDSSPLPGPGLARIALRSLGDPSAPLHLHPTPDPAYLRWLLAFWRRCNRRDQLLGTVALRGLGRRTLALYDRLEADGLSFEMHRTGLLHAHLDEGAARRALAHDRAVAPDDARIPDRLLTGRDVEELEPALSSQVAAAYLVETERSVRPDTVTRALADGLVAGGGQLLERTRATHAVRRGGRVVAVATERGTIDCDRLVVAAGIDTGSWLRRLGIRLPQIAGKGYSFTVPLRSAPRRPLDLAAVRVAVTPMSSGVRVAGTMELGRVRPGPVQTRIAAMVAGGRRYLADWPSDFDAGRALTANAWAGMRPVTSDGLPVLDAVEAAPGLYVATGHAMEGMILGPASGEAMAEFVVSGRRPEVLLPFMLGRFA